MRFLYTLAFSLLSTVNAIAQTSLSKNDTINKSIILKFNSLSEELLGQVDSLLKSLEMEGLDQGRIPLWLQKRVPGPDNALNKETQPFLGIYFGNPNEHNDNPLGAKVMKVVTGSAAEKAGLLPGDIIYNIDGKDILSLEEVSALISRKKAGDELQIKYRRDETCISTKAKLQSLEDTNIYDRWNGYSYSGETAIEKESPLYGFIQPSKPRLGVQITDLTGQSARIQKIKNKKGALVTGIDKGSLAEKMGVKVNDVIISVNNHPIENIEELKTIIQKGKIGDAISLTIMRQGKKKKITGELYCYGNAWQPEEKYRIYRFKADENTTHQKNTEELREEIRDLKEKLKLLEEEINNKGE